MIFQMRSYCEINMPASPANNKKEGVFLYLLFLTGFFLLLEVSFFIQSNKVYFADFTSVADKLHIPAAVLPGLLFFLFAQFLVHLGYCLGVWGVTLLVSNFLRLNSHQTIFASMVFWLQGLVTALIANQYFFPNSKFAELTALLFFTPHAIKITFFVLVFTCVISLLLAGGGLLKYGIQRPRYFLVGIIVVALSASFFQLATPSKVHDAATVTKPNIILIGVDSLRPDFLSHFGRDIDTPFFDKFVSGSTVFSQAITPLARTFPSWTSILTGQYPRQTGIRFNLAQQQHAVLTNTLPHILQQHGYETIYATDETRFSNIDKNFGFNRIITPPMGLNDFLLGTLNDFPFSNLLVNTVIGKWLFPYSYGNRPVYFTYDPNSFINLIKPALQENRKKPLFLAVHFCLAHFPYLWSDAIGSEQDIVKRYEASVKRVDEQVSDFFVVLKQSGLLEHAIVVMLSDHGEALELHGDRITKNELFIPARETKVSVPKFYPPSLDKEEVDQSGGHGTDVLGLSQYYSLLAFKLYGLGEQKIKVIPGVVSLLAIKPTLLDLLHIKPDVNAEGVSLAPMITTNKKIAFLPRHIFIESDFTPEAIRTVYPETRKALLEGVQLFQVDPITTRLTFKDAMSQMIINSKQYADIYGDWMLALYPQSQNTHMAILIKLSTGEWTNDLQSSFAKQSPASGMLAALKGFYGDEIQRTILSS